MNKKYYHERKRKYDKQKLENQTKINVELIIKEESQKILESLIIEWYKMIHNNEIIIDNFNYLLDQIVIIYDQFPINEENDVDDLVIPRISLNWSSISLEDVYFYFILHLIPFQHLIQIRNSYEKSVYRIIMIIFHSNFMYLNSWLIKSDKEILNSIINACITLIKNQKLTKSEEKTYLKKWDDLRIQFIYSLISISIDIPSFMFLMILNFIFVSYNKENNKDWVIIDICGINPMMLACEITVAGEMIGDDGVMIDEDEVSIMTIDEDTTVDEDDDVIDDV